MTNDKTISTFNQAEHQMHRLHYRWIKAGRYSEQGKLQEWNWVLDIIWRELSPDAEMHGRKKIDGKKYNHYKYNIEKLNKMIARMQSKKIMSKRKNRNLLYKLLDKKERILRDLEEKCGKGSKRKSGDEDMIQ